MMVQAQKFQDDASGTLKMFNARIAKYQLSSSKDEHSWSYNRIFRCSNIICLIILKQMNNYQDEESGFKIQEKIYTWGRFLLFFLTGVILLIVSFPFSGFLLINPYPFVLLFSLGSLLILIAIIQVTEYKTIFSQAGTVVYFIALLGGLYTGVFKIGYLTTLGIMVIQILALLYLMAALLPGGQAGLKNYVLSKIKT
ncbi:unnamed protein product [Paramecium sonneborni]|uniref:Vesicle transport protein n=1 Tax=Paramecium sonneborni TaxID=65129 RepID=A0A8S1R2D1_9CILI|nr:unnamed protein product [Paramecium sonneborni]